MIQRLQAKRNEEGFTLIELLIVIIVLGILAAIVVFAVSGTKKDATAATCKTDFKSVELSAEAVVAKSALALTGVAEGDLFESAKKGGLLKGSTLPSTDSYKITWNQSAGTPIAQTKDADGAFVDSTCASLNA